MTSIPTSRKSAPVIVSLHASPKSVDSLMLSGPRDDQVMIISTTIRNEARRFISVLKLSYIALRRYL
jgi:hypothetical protein